MESNTTQLRPEIEEEAALHLKAIYNKISRVKQLEDRTLVIAKPFANLENFFAAVYQREPGEPDTKTLLEVTLSQNKPVSGFLLSIHELAEKEYAISYIADYPTMEQVHNENPKTQLISLNDKGSIDHLLLGLSKAPIVMYIPR